MAIYVYFIETGELHSYISHDTTIEEARANNQLASQDVLDAAGLTAVDGLPPLGPTTQWDPVTKTTITVDPPYEPNFLPSYEFIMLFTPDEHAAISASNDSLVRQFMSALSVTTQVDLNSSNAHRVVDQFVALGLITQDNADLILSGKPSQG